MDTAEPATGRAYPRKVRVQVGFRLTNFGQKLTVIGLTCLALFAAAGAAGLVGIANIAGGAPKTPAFVTSVFAHTASGILVTLVFLLAGAAAARILARGKIDLVPSLLYGYPVSLVLKAAIAAVTLAMPIAVWPVFAALLALALLPLTQKASRPTFLQTLKVAVLLLPPALLFGAWMALQWHGPTASLDGSPMGDTVFYATNMYALHAQAAPLLNLGIEGETFGNYFNQLNTALGAAVMQVAPIDPFQWLLGGVGGGFILTHGVLLWAYLQTSQGQSRLTLSAWLLFLSAALYPSWHLMSPPAVEIAPLAISIWFMAKRGGGAGPVLAAVAAVTGSLLGKVTGGVAIAGFAFSALAEKAFVDRGRLFWISAAIAAVSAAIFAGLAFRYGPGMLRADYVGSYGYAYLIKYKVPVLDALPWIVRDVGVCLLAISVWKIMRPLQALSVTLSLALALIYPYLFFAAFMGASILIALALMESPRFKPVWRWLFLTAATLTAAAALLLDVAGKINGVIWVVALGGALLIAASLGPHDKSSGKPSTLLPGLIAVSVLFGAIAVARGQWIVDSGWRQGRPPDLTADVYDIWTNVRRRTEANAIVFTDQTGPDAYLTGSWNGYAASGQRQVFIANMNGTLAFQAQTDRIAIALACNNAVLDGTMPPNKAGFMRDYGAVYAVTKPERVFGEDWERVYANKSWHLWRWQGGGVAARSAPSGPCADLLAIRKGAFK